MENSVLVLFDDKTKQAVLGAVEKALAELDNTGFETPGGVNTMVAGDPIDPQANDTWDATQLMGNATNFKRIVDEWAAIAQSKAVQAASLQDMINAKVLAWADDAHAVSMRLANDGASLSQLQANNAALASQRATSSAQTWDNFNFAGETDTTAQGAMANNLANQMRSVIFEAMQAAVAQTQQTSAPAQGTTGVAQGSLQTGAASVNTALISSLAEVMGSLGVQLAKIQDALAVILVKVVGEAVEVKPT